MLTRIDHVMICVPDLGRGIDAYTRIGFIFTPAVPIATAALTTPSRSSRTTISSY